MAVQTQIQVRRGTAATWTSTNPTLAAGEWGLETDTGKYKIGTGSAVWTSLGYASILPSTVTTKGDLLAASSNATVTRQAVGSDGYQLVADSSQTTGLGWAGNVAAGKNAVINGGFDIWQRGTSSTANGTAAGNGYTADRWQSVYTGGAMTTSRQATGDATNLPNIQYCARVQRDSGQTSTNNVIISQSLESVNSIPLVGKTVTLSFYARKGANFSGASNNLIYQFSYGTGTDQNALFSYINSTSISSGTATLTTTWQRFTTTATISTSATEIGMYFYYAGVGTAGANDYFEITGVQLELGSSATPFSRAGGTIQGELAACQRYYSTSAIGGTHLLTTCTALTAWDSTYRQGFSFPVPMRVAPTVTIYSRNNTSGKMSSSATGSDTAAATASNIGNNQVWAISSSLLVASTVGYEVSYTASAEL